MNNLAKLLGKADIVIGHHGLVPAGAKSESSSTHISAEALHACSCLVSVEAKSEDIKKTNIVLLIAQLAVLSRIRSTAAQAENVEVVEVYGVVLSRSKAVFVKLLADPDPERQLAG